MQAQTIIKESGVLFGTSGARDLVDVFSANVCAAFTIAFIDAIENDFSFDTVAIAIDNRPSSYAMAQACASALKLHGLDVKYYGVIPTPALAFKAMQDCMPSIMVTGSHIPFDRNGLKFYRPDGEISKQDEVAIFNSPVKVQSLPANLIELNIDKSAKEAYCQRYACLFTPDTLRGKKIGVYEHSSAGRDIYKQLFIELGAEVISLERSDHFIPIDTEAVSEQDKLKAIDWVNEYGFDAIFSTDGDGDRPLLSDEKGQWLNGDLLGLLCSKLLSVDSLAVPVSCNTAIEKSGLFMQVNRTKIGSPYVIAEFNELLVNSSRVAGFEANGGYLLASDISFNGQVISSLPTRDALLPALIVLAQPKSISHMLDELPQSFVASNRIKEFPTSKSKALLTKLSNDVSLLTALYNLEPHQKVDVTDGLRVTLNNNDIVHLRPSGNAPELRCYAESSSLQNAQQIVIKALDFARNIAV